MLLASSHASVCSRWLLCEAGVGSIQKVQQPERMQVGPKKRKFVVAQAMGSTPDSEESGVQTDDDGFEMEGDGTEDSVAGTFSMRQQLLDADHTQSLAGGPLRQEMEQREEEQAVGAEVQEKPEGKEWWQMDGHQFVTRG